MSDLERLLIEALRDEGESYEPTDQLEARRKFVERARRRRWIGFAQVAAAGAIAVTAIFFFISPVPDDDSGPRPQDLAGAPEIVARVPVGGEPMSIDSTSGSEVWVTGGDRIVAIDPESNETTNMIIDLPADEIAVGEESLWVARDGTTGTVTQIDPATGDVIGTRLEVAATEGVTWDIATDGDRLWTVNGWNGSVISVDGNGRGTEEGYLPVTHPYEDRVLSDVAVGDDEVWVLDAPQGLVSRVSRVPNEEGPMFNVDLVENPDLAAGLSYVWVSPGDGTLVRVDPVTGDKTDLDLGDSYMDLTVHENSVWALVNVDDDRKELFEVDPGTMEVIGEPLEIVGDANDVVAEAGSVWVADGSGDVLRIEPSRDTDGAPLPAPDDPPTPTADLPPVEDVVFVYSQDGDVFAETRDGSVQLTNTPEREEDPAISPDGRYVVFERRADGEGSLAVLDTRTGNECCFRPGEDPAFGANDMIAWTLPSKKDGHSEVWIGLFNSEYTQGPFDPLPEGSVPVSIRRLAWDQSMELLYLEGGYEGSTLWVADVIIGNDNLPSDLEGFQTVYPEDSNDGAVYAGISAGLNANVIKACCRLTEGDVLTEGELGEVTAVAEQDHPYNGQVPLDDLDIDFNSQDLFTAYLGTVGIKDGQGSIEWVDENKANWLVGDGTGLWVVDVDGGVTEMPFVVDGGASAPNPLHR